ncbi:nonstructural protein [Microviridae sp.]|nr:nonstructural protein [Microviridae sp.]
MKHGIYSVYDSAIEAYLRPFPAPADGAAIRSFQDEVLTPDSPMNQHPEHYSLFKVSTFDDASGEMQKELPIVLAKAHEIMAHAKNQIINIEEKRQGAQ